MAVFGYVVVLLRWLSPPDGCPGWSVLSARSRSPNAQAAAVPADSYFLRSVQAVPHRHSPECPPAQRASPDSQTHHRISFARDIDSGQWPSGNVSGTRSGMQLPCQRTTMLISIAAMKWKMEGTDVVQVAAGSQQKISATFW